MPMQSFCDHVFGKRGPILIILLLILHSVMNRKAVM